MKPRVLFIAGSNGMRGANRTLAESLRLALCTEFDCLVAAPLDEGPFLPVLTELGVPVLRCDQPYWVTAGAADHWLLSMRRLPAAVRQVQEIIRSKRIDVVYTNAGQTPVGALAAARERKPHVWHVRECYLNPATGLSSPTGQPALAAAIGELATILIVASQHLAAEYRPCVHPEKMRVIHSGIDCRPFAVLSGPDHARRVLALGTTSAAKGLDDLVTAATLLAADKVSFEVDVLGAFDSIDYLRRIEVRLAKHGLGGRFRLRGWQQNVKRWMESASVVCSPSHAESFCRAVAEGMAGARPVVATRSGGPDEIVMHGETGYLVPVGEPPALAAALGDILSDPEKGRAMGEKGRERALQYYDVRYTAGQCGDAVRQALDCAGADLPPAGVAEMLLTYWELAAPRILLGKKWQTCSRLFRALGRPI